MEKFKYFELCEREEHYQLTLPLLVQYGCWYEMKEVDRYGWNVYAPYLHEKAKLPNMINACFMHSHIIGGKYTGSIVPGKRFSYSFKDALHLLSELQQIYVKLETRIFDDFDDKSNYEVLAKDHTDADLIQLILARS